VRSDQDANSTVSPPSRCEGTEEKHAECCGAFWNCMADRWAFYTDKASLFRTHGREAATERIGGGSRPGRHAADADRGALRDWVSLE
jgi:hypothetical protein